MDITTAVMNALNAQAAFNQQQQANMVLSIAIGFFSGLVPALLGLVRRQWGLGFFGFILCLGGGYLGGWIFAIPLPVVFTSIIGSSANRQEHKKDIKGENANDNSCVFSETYWTSKFKLYKIGAEQIEGRILVSSTPQDIYI